MGSELRIAEVRHFDRGCSLSGVDGGGGRNLRHQDRIFRLWCARYGGQDAARRTVGGNSRKSAGKLFVANVHGPKADVAVNHRPEARK